MIISYFSHVLTRITALCLFTFVGFSSSAQNLSYDTIPSELEFIVNSMNADQLVLGETSLKSVKDLYNNARDESSSSAYVRTLVTEKSTMQVKAMMSSGKLDAFIILLDYPNGTGDAMDVLKEKLIEVMGKPDMDQKYSEGSFYYAWSIKGKTFYLSYLNPEKMPDSYRIDIK